MKPNNITEVILFAKVSTTETGQRELAKWMTTTGLPLIGRQEKKVKKIFSRSLKDSPAIYMS